MKRLKDFSRAQIKKIATEYARSEPACNHSYFEREYEISDSTFYNLLNKAIIESIVDEEIARQIGEKASRNSTVKAGKYAGVRSKIHNEHLLLKRKNFRFPKKEAKEIVIKYSESSLSKEKFCEKNCITKKLFDNAMIRAITQNWITNKCYKRLKSKAIKNHDDSPEVYELFQKLDEMRNIHKEKQR